MTRKTLIFRYILFALIAIFVNLFVQRIIFHVGNGKYLFIIAILFGTLSGLIIKFLLDKYWIFSDMSKQIGATGKKFAKYSIFGVLTTFLFWFSEMTFWAIWETNIMRELGAVIGLTLGYSIKYHLDKRYVFNDIEVDKC